MQDREDKEANQEEAENRRDQTVDQHRNLKIERFFPVLVDLRKFAALDQPDDEWPKNMANRREEKSNQGAGVTKHCPGPRLS